MFIEKITEDDVENFLWKFRLDADKVVSYGKEIFVRTADDYLANTISEFILSDFECRNVEGQLKGYEKQLTRTWRDTMKDKFGKEYKIALKKHLKENINK